MKSLIGKWIEQYKEIASIKREPSLISNYEHPEEKRHSCISPWQYNHVIQRLWTL